MLSRRATLAVESLRLGAVLEEKPREFGIAAANRVVQRRQAGASVDQIGAALQQHEHAEIGFTSIPNARLSEDAAALRDAVREDECADS